MAYVHKNSYFANIMIGGESYAKYLVFPINVQQTLDESLDSATLTLVGMPRAEPFEPFCEVTLGTDSEGRIDMLLSNDEVTERIGYGTYTHELTLIEPTKALERYVMGAKAFTQHTRRTYVSEGGYAPVSVRKHTKIYNTLGDVIDEETKSFTSSAEAYPKTMEASDELWLVGFNDIWDESWGSIKNGGALDVFENKNLSAAVNLFFSENGSLSISDLVLSTPFFTQSVDPQLGLDQTFSVTLGEYGNKAGYFYALYLLRHRSYRYQLNVRVKAVTEYGVVVKMQAVKKQVAKEVEPYSIYDVLEILLRQAEPIMYFEQPRFALNLTAEQYKLYKNTVAPEFRFADGRTLWEDLREVGKYVHAIPRLKKTDGGYLRYAVTFDKLGDTKRADLSKGLRFSGGGGAFGEEFVNALEASVANFMNSDDELEGSVVVPCDGSYISLRSDEARIKEENGYIPTPFPIEKLISLKAFATVNGSNTEYDLTPYVYEKSEYDLLSSFNSSTGGRNKTHALYYTQGKRNIEGLWYRIEDQTSDYENVKQRYAIHNVFNYVTGVDQSSIGYFSIVFQIKYVPSISARVRQLDTDFSRIGKLGVLAMPYNQSANKLAARAFGENMRGRLAMISNPTRRATYMFPTYSDVPRAGLLFDDGIYISSVTSRIYPDFCLSELSMSEGYNELGGYVSLNSAYRQFEIPEESERHYHIDELCLITATLRSHDTKCLTCGDGLKMILRSIGGVSKGTHTDITLAKAWTFDDEHNALTSVMLPVMSTSVGNSLYFAFRFEDNYSAGSRSVHTNESELGGTMRYTEYVGYGDDSFARARYLSFELLYGSHKSGNWLQQAHAYPEFYGAGVSGGTVAFGSNSDKWQIDKDAADGMDVSFQLHFVSDSGFIIGSALARSCPLVRESASTSPAIVVFYKKPLDELTGNTAEQREETRSITVDYDNACIVMPSYDKKFASWRIERDGECLIGCNSSVLPHRIYFRSLRGRRK